MLDMALYITAKKLRMRYWCYSLKRATDINFWLLVAMLSAPVVSHLIMYEFLAAKDLDNQWYTYFSGDGIKDYLGAILIYKFTKGTRHFGLATAYMVNCFIDMSLHLFDYHQKYENLAWLGQGIVLGLAYFAIKDYYTRCKNENTQ